MAAWNIAKVFRTLAPRQFTGKVFPGPLYELCALAHCRRRGYRVLDRNLHLKGGEIDCLAEERSTKALIIIEVRGRRACDFAPRLSLSYGKRYRLRRLGERIGVQYRRQVRIEFLEVIGRVPKRRWQVPFARWLIAWWPELLGWKLTSLSLDG